MSVCHLYSLLPAPPAREPLLRLGARVFLLRDPAGATADLVWTLPGAGGAAVVLAPRGFGRPVLACGVAGAWQTMPDRLPCPADRWAPVGGVGAWWSRGEGGPPSAAWPPYQPEGAVGPGGLCVVAAALPDGPVRRRVSARLGLDTEWDGVRLTAPLPRSAADPEYLMVRARRLGSRLRPLVSGPMSLVIGPSVSVAARVAGLAPEGMLGVVPDEAAEAWCDRPGSGAGWSRGRRVGRWRGPAIPDLDGAVSLSRIMADDLADVADGTTVRVTLHGENGFCCFRLPIRRGGARHLGGLVVLGVSEHFFQVGPVSAMTIAVIEEVEPALRRGVLSGASKIPTWEADMLAGKG